MARVNPVVYVLRGLPGSGKSTLAQLLAMPVMDYGYYAPPTATIVSADHYFIDKASGQYRFVPSRLPQAHAQCKLEFEAALDRGVERIVVDNTNIKAAHYMPYVTTAEKSGYEVVVITMRQRDPRVCFERCTHKVSLEAIARMAKEFQE